MAAISVVPAALPSSSKPFTPDRGRSPSRAGDTQIQVANLTNEAARAVINTLPSTGLAQLPPSSTPAAVDPHNLFGGRSAHSHQASVPTSFSAPHHPMSAPVFRVPPVPSRNQHQLRSGLQPEQQMADLEQRLLKAVSELRVGCGSQQLRFQQVQAVVADAEAHIQAERESVNDVRNQVINNRELVEKIDANTRRLEKLEELLGKLGKEVGTIHSEVRRPIGEKLFKVVEENKGALLLAAIVGTVVYWIRGK